MEETALLSEYLCQDSCIYEKDLIVVFHCQQSGQKVKLCPGYRRAPVVYTSLNNTVEITFRTSHVQPENRHFLMHFHSKHAP